MQPEAAAASGVSAFDTVRTSARRVLSRLGLLRPAFNAWRAVRELRPAVYLQNRRLRSLARERLAIPPGRLIYSVCGTRSVQHFLASGSTSAESIRGALIRVDRPVERLSSVLDMGCGCGRVLRQWHDVHGPLIHGTDYNPAGVNWVQQHLPYVRAQVNGLAPPLAYEAQTFDLVYAISVLTHLPEVLQGQWMEEFRRILRPGGVLIVTLCGTGMLSRLLPEERERFARGELVVVDERYAGTNLCSAYHPDQYVNGAWSAGFRILEKTPHTTDLPYQDQWTLERIE